MSTPRYTPQTTPVDHIDCANIVGCVPSANGFTLLHVEPDTEPVSLKATPARTLPDDFISQYLINPPDHVVVHIIVSLLAGSCLAESFFQHALDPLLGALGLQETVDYIVHRTTSAHSVFELARDVFLRQANEGVRLRIILLSGDGGTVDVVNGLLCDSRSPSFVVPSIALIPMGTANALAHSLGIAADGTNGLATFARGSPERLPLLQARFSSGAKLLVDEGRKEEALPRASDGPESVLYGAVVCSWAMHAGLVADSDTAEYRKYGVQRFRMAAKEALYPVDGSQPHRYRARISVLRSRPNEAGLSGWETVGGQEHAYVLATLVSNLEKKFTISPRSSPLDGRLYLIRLAPMPSDEIMRVMALAYLDGKHVDESCVMYADIEGLRIELMEEEDRWRRVCVDGKVVLVERGGWVEVRRTESELEHVVDVLCLR